MSAEITKQLSLMLAEIDRWHREVAALTARGTVDPGYLSHYILTEVWEALAEAHFYEEDEQEVDLHKRHLELRELFDVFVLLRQYQRAFFPHVDLLADLDNPVSTSDIGKQRQFYDLLQSVVIDLGQGNIQSFNMIVSLIIARYRALDALGEISEVGLEVLAGNRANRPVTVYQASPEVLKLSKKQQLEALTAQADFAGPALRTLRNHFGDPLADWMPIVFADYIHYQPNKPQPKMPLLEAIALVKREWSRWSLNQAAGKQARASSYHVLFQKALAPGLLGPKHFAKGLILAGAKQVSAV